MTAPITTTVTFPSGTCLYSMSTSAGTTRQLRDLSRQTRHRLAMQERFLLAGAIPVALAECEWIEALDHARDRLLDVLWELLLRERGAGLDGAYSEEFGEVGA